jgi:uncharacterized membrane protein
MTAKPPQKETREPFPWFGFLRIGTALIVCLAFTDSPREVYSFIKIAVCGVTAYSAYIAIKINKIGLAWLYGFTALLFNPIFPAKLGGDTWEILDVFVIIVILASFKVLPSEQLEKYHEKD